MIMSEKMSHEIPNMEPNEDHLLSLGIEAENNQH